MKINFEIKSQLGLAREGILSINEQKFRTPSLIVPIHPSLTFLDPEFPIYDNLINKSRWMGNEIHDPLNVFDVQNKEYADISNLDTQMVFFESKDSWGVKISEEKIIELKNELQSSTDFDESEYSRIITLPHNVGAKGHYKYKEFDMSLLEKRFQLYESVIFPNFSNHKFVVEIAFVNKHEEILDKFLEFVLNNRDRIIGVKIRDIFSNLGDYESILHWIMKMKEMLPSNLIWIVSGKIFVHQFALAVYLGFDIMETNYLITSGSQGLYMTRNDAKWAREVGYPPCSCPICCDISERVPKCRDTLNSKSYRNYIIQHNLFMASQEINMLTNFVYYQTLRTYVENCTHNDPSIASALRCLDTKYADAINKRFPLICSHKVISIGSESLSRPEVINFINQVKSENTPALVYKYVLLLPCSAGKPYSKSRSHQNFLRVLKRSLKKLNNNLKMEDIHQIILTSPLGIVPREIESIFPAAHYDIPVTGKWDQEEILNTGECLFSWLLKVDKKQHEKIIVLAHLPGGYQSACKYCESKLIEHYDNMNSRNPFVFHHSMGVNENFSASSEKGLENLQSMLVENLVNVENDDDTLDLGSEKKNGKDEILKRINRLNKNEIMIRAILDYQFGKGAGDLIRGHGIFIQRTRNPHFEEIVIYDGAGKLKLARLYNDTGFLRLSNEGALFLYEKGLRKKVLKLTDEKITGNTVFRPIVSEIDPSIHPNDEVFVVNSNGVFFGTGPLVQHADDVYSSNYGKVCEMHKKRSI